MNVHVTIDTSRLSDGLAAAAKYTKRTLPQVVNTAAYWIAVNAKNSMPYVEVKKIDIELGTIVTAVIGKRGQPLSKKYAKNRRLSGGKMGDIVKDVPLAALIIAASAKPGSRYNSLTNSRWAIGKNPFKGVSRAAGAATMRSLIHRMINRRHSSSKFLLSGWIPAIQKLLPYSMQKFMRGSGNPLTGVKEFLGGAGVNGHSEFGSATPAVDGFTVMAVIENNIGAMGKNAENYNQALIRYGAPVLQSAVDREGDQQMKYALGKMEKEMKTEVDKYWH